MDGSVNLAESKVTKIKFSSINMTGSSGFVGLRKMKDQINSWLISIVGYAKDNFIRKLKCHTHTRDRTMLKN
jgi:hypothetical protein